MSMRKHARVRKPTATSEPASTGAPNLDPQPLNTPQPNSAGPASGHSFANVRVFPSDTGRSPQRAAAQRAMSQRATGQRATNQNTGVVQRAAKPKEELKPARPEPINEQEEVDLLAQPLDDTAWSAGFAMVANAVDDEDHEYDPSTIATMTGLDMTKRQDWEDIRKGAAALELSPMEVRAATPAMWAHILSEFGPFWLVENDQPDHALVVGGMSGDGTAEKTDLMVYRSKPLKSGMMQNQSFQKIIEDFRLQDPDHPKVSIVHGQQ